MKFFPRNTDSIGEFAVFLFVAVDKEEELVVDVFSVHTVTLVAD
jgi:hypothetical protein